MIRCIAIDDEPLALAQITGYIAKVPFLELIQACTNAFEALDIFSRERVDLIFADINMPDLNGMDFVKSLQNRPMVIFTTAYSEYAVEGFRIDAIDYLLKPFGFNEFMKAVNKAQHYMELLQNNIPDNNTLTKTEEEEEKYLFVKVEYKIVKLTIDKILYIEGKSEYVRIYTEEMSPVMTLLSMKSLENRLPAHKFMRIHRSYIINLQKIEAIANNRVIFNRTTYIPVGDQYKKSFNNYIEKHLAQGKRI